MKTLRIVGIFLAPLLLAAGLRLPQLSQRPMHCDEAVHADKFGTLLEKGEYEYDPQEYHGPTLYYLTLVSAHLQGAARYVDLNEATLRIVPVVFGIALVGAHALATPALGLGAAAAAAVLVAISPAMVFYSRYYIHEALLVFFSFGALLSLCWYLRRREAAAAVLTGVFVGLMHATKETSPVMVSGMALGAALTVLGDRWQTGRMPEWRAGVRASHVLLAALAALLVSFVLFSSFLTHPRGVIDSFRAYGLYIDRTAANSWHYHPWHYYLGLLLYFPARGTPVWTESLIVVLAIVGSVVGWKKHAVPEVDGRIVRFLTYYTLLTILFYAAIRYKTPWCLLGFLHGMILLAGVGVVFLWRLLSRPVPRILLVACLLAATVQLGWQAWAGSFRFDADPRNPYVYAHTGYDVFTIVRRIEGLARAHPMGYANPVEIVSRENLWPLPWYLRRFTDLRWWNGVSEKTPPSPVVLASPEMEPALVRRFYEVPPPGERELYMNIYDRYVELRPQVELRGYAIKSLWDEYRSMEAESLRAAGPPGVER